MSRSLMLAIAFAATTCLTVPTAASAEGKTDQARKAIAAAQAKIDAANIVGAAGDAPRLHAEAVRVLHIAQDELNHHAKDEAIRDATRASEIADQALAASQRERTSEQQAATGAAQAQAAEANARAADAQAAAAAAQADAAAARAAPPVIVQQPATEPAPTTTTVTTTETVKDSAVVPVHHKRVLHKRVVHKKPVATRTKTTTTTVKTQN
jgi:multidrug efflux pump subunit AcrA (membrane-fusion protein)